LRQAAKAGQHGVFPRIEPRMRRRILVPCAFFAASMALMPAAHAQTGPATGIFSAVVSGLLNPNQPADPFGLGGGAIAPGATIGGTFSIASSFYAVLITGPAQIAGYSDGVPGLIGVTFQFGAASYTQSDADFNEISFASSGGNGVYDQVSFNANTVSATGQGTQTIFDFDPSVPLSGQTLQGLVDTPLSAALGTIDFYEFLDDVEVGGFTAQITMLDTDVPEPGTLALLLVPLGLVGAARASRRGAFQHRARFRGTRPSTR
jgi:hypothetical protein